MNLNIQLFSFTFSLIFGIFLYFLLEWFNMFNNRNKIIVKILLSLIFVLTLSLLYFIVLLYINNGYLHVYFLILIMVGYIIVDFIKSFYFTHKKKKK